MKRTLLVPTDFSKNAQWAADYAVALAKKGGYKLVLLHAFKVSYPTSEIPIQMVTDEISIDQQRSEEKLSKICKQVERLYKIKCSSMCMEGSATEVIIKTAKKIDPDFIVMGTKGVSGIKKILFGSNTAYVIENAPCPVIAIPKGGTFRGGDILFSTNYHASDSDAVKGAAKIARQFNSRFLLFHAADNELTKETEEERMDSFVRSVSKKVNYRKMVPFIAYGKTPEKAIQKYIKEKKPGLIAMSTKQRSVLEKLFSHSITKELAYHTRTPLLAFQYKK